jgi:hypothetical protein
LRRQAEIAEHAADLAEMAADLDDRGRLGGREPGAQLGLGQRRRHDRQHVVAGGERRPGGGGAGEQRRHAGHDLDRAAVGQAPIEIQERAIEERVALAQHCHVAPRRGVAWR